MGPNLIGQRFGRLVVVARVASRHRKAHWSLACDCGGTNVAATGTLRSGLVKSCGCLNQELRIRRNTKHGHATRGRTHPLYWRWLAMVKRCTSPRDPFWESYGGRGITVCERWRDFAAFLSDVGEPPTPQHSLDRIDNNRGYEPDNVRWATPLEQRHNRREVSA